MEMDKNKRKMRNLVAKRDHEIILDHLRLSIQAYSNKPLEAMKVLDPHGYMINYQVYLDRLGRDRIEPISFILIGKDMKAVGAPEGLEMKAFISRLEEWAFIFVMETRRWHHGTCPECNKARLPQICEERGCDNLVCDSTRPIKRWCCSCLREAEDLFT